MLTLERALAAAQAQVPGCFAAGYVSIPGGALLCAGASDAAERAALDTAATAAAGLFDPRRGADLSRFFGAATAAESPALTAPLSEAVFMTSETVHLYERSRRDPDRALVLLCRRSVNIGMAIAKARLALPGVEAVAP